MTDFTVSSGQTSSWVTVNSGDTITVLSGGTAIDTDVNSGGLLNDSGVTSGTFVLGSGLEQVFAGGVASGAFLSGSGTAPAVFATQFVSAGGLAVSTTVTDSSEQEVASGGVATGTTVSGFLAFEAVLSGGRAIGARVSQGEQDVAGIASGTVLASPIGNQTISSGGIASSTVVSGSQTVLSGGVAIGAIVEFTGSQSVLGLASGTSVSGGGQIVSSGGIARDNVLTGFGLESGTQVISASGVASATEVMSGGIQTVAILGVASGTTVSSGGEEVISTRGVASNSIVEAGGTVVDGGTLIYAKPASTVFAGILSGSGGLTESGPGSLVMSGDESAFSGTVGISGGTLELTSGGAAGSGPIVFGGGGVLQIDGTTMPTNTISKFIAGDTIDLAGVPFSTGDSATYSGSTLTVSNGGGTVLATLTATGEPYSASSFAVAVDPTTSGIDITTNIPCFGAGTRIATPAGQIAVEDLREGDLVLTASGEAQPIVWIGRSRVDCRRHAKPELVIPVRIRAGAFADGVPARDLVLSPGHAIFCPHPSPLAEGAGPHPNPLPQAGEGTQRDSLSRLRERAGVRASRRRQGVLIPVGCLVNGVSIVREENAAEVTYYHVELAEHDVLLAEGLPAESYLDDGNRAAFDNGGPYRMLHPDYTPKSWANACAPMRESGSEVAAVKQRLRERLAELGCTLQTGGGIEVCVRGPGLLRPRAFSRGSRNDGDQFGIRLKPRFARNGLYHFMLPAGTEEARIASPRGIPAGLLDDSADNRWLGAQLALVLLDGEWLPLDSPILAAGFHALEENAGGTWRWTNGDATLRLPPCNKPRRLELFVRDVMRSWTTLIAEQAA